MNCESCVYNIDGDFCLANVFELCDLFSENDEAFDKTIYAPNKENCTNYKEARKL